MFLLYSSLALAYDFGTDLFGFDSTFRATLETAGGRGIGFCGALCFGKLGCELNGGFEGIEAGFGWTEGCSIGFMETCLN